MSLEEENFNNYMERMFTRYGSDYKQVCMKWNKKHKNSSPRIKDRLRTYGHFYYFICLPEETRNREEWKLVGITSLIDAMMGDSDFKDVFTYFKSSYPGKNSIDNFKEFEEEYLSKYGANKRIVKYFDQFMPIDKVTLLLSKIKVWDKKTSEMKSLNGIPSFAKFLYQMRSDFVHKADMQSFCAPEHFAALVSVGGKAYDIRFDVDEITKLFEESFVRYWEKMTKEENNG